MFGEEAVDFGGGVWSVGVGIGAVGCAAGPGVAGAVDGPVLGEGVAVWCSVDGSGAGVVAGGVLVGGFGGG